MLYNEADLLFGSSDTTATLTDAKLRTSTKWITFPWFMLLYHIRLNETGNGRCVKR